MKKILFDFPCPTPLGTHLSKRIGAETGQFLRRQFPDGETYLQILTPMERASVVVLANLLNPNNLFLDLLFLADALQTQGAQDITLISPYLPYMRQDKIFNPGETLTSRTFAKGISNFFDRLITIDPHLHRIKTLDEIYTIPSTVLHATQPITQWIQDNISDPFIIGPDGESQQWAQEIAQGSPWITLSKVRHGDRAVEITWPPMDGLGARTPVLVDDIISSGTTIIHSLEHLKTISSVPPICITIHPVFAEDSFERIQVMGVQSIISTNTIPHPSNAIDISHLIADGF